MRASQPAWVAVEAEKAALIKYPFEIFGIRSVVAVIDFYPAKIDTLFFKDRNLASVSGSKRPSSLDQDKIRDLISSLFTTKIGFFDKRLYSSAPVRSKPRRHTILLALR